MLQVQIETGVPNWYFRIQRNKGKLNIIMHRDVIEFSLVVNKKDFRDALNTLCLLEENNV